MSNENKHKSVSDISLEEELGKNHHLGHALLKCFRKRNPDHICQIDAASGKQETYGSVLKRTVRLARALKQYGLRPGDVITVAGINHLNLRIPFYAGHYVGLPVSGTDPFFKYAEVKVMINLAKPKAVFCENDSYDIYKRVKEDLNLDFEIITFDDGENSLEKFIEKYDDGSPIDDFEPTKFDGKKVYAWLPSTSGTTGKMKLVAMTHTMVMEALHGILVNEMFGRYCEDGQKTGFLLSPPQWLSAYVTATCYPLLNFITVQTSKTGSFDHYCDLINQYKPSTTILNPATTALILFNSNRQADMTCFDVFNIGGSKVYKEVALELKRRVRPDTEIIEAYGQTEILVSCRSVKETPFGSCGGFFPGREVKLVDPETNQEITEPNKPGELLYKGPCLTEYYNDPEETAKLFTKDGWLRTGDMLYRDEQGNFFFIDRLKMLMKYRNHHVVPTELEEVILKHQGVLEVCVTSIEHLSDGEWPMACVVRRQGCDVTEDEIQQLVKETLSDVKQLRGGVLFIDSLPKTPTGKVARQEIKQLVRSKHTK